MNSNFIRYDGYSKFIHSSNINKEWTETVPWEFVEYIALDDIIYDSSSYGDYINLLSYKTAQTIKYNPTTGSQDFIEYDYLTTGLSMELIPRLTNTVDENILFYSGHQYSTNMYIRKSLDNGSTYNNSVGINTSLYEYCQDIKPFNYLGVDYVYMSHSSSNGTTSTTRLYRSSDGINWSMLNGTTSINAIGSLEVFRNELYGGCINVAPDGLFRFNHDTSLWELVAKPDNNEMKGLTNYNDKYLFFLHDVNNLLYRYDGSSVSLMSASMAQPPESMINYGGLIIIGAGQGTVYHIDPETGVRIYYTTLNHNPDSNSSIYSMVQHTDGYLYAFSSNGTLNNFEVWRMKRELK